MPSDKPDKVEKWRHPASAVKHLSQTAFVEKALENGLRVVEMGGYLYLAEETDEGHDMFRAYGPKWAYLYQARRVTTNTNAAGGAIIVDVSVATGQTAQLVGLRASHASAGNHTLSIALINEDNDEILYLATGGAAGTAKTLRLPSIGTASNADGNVGQSLGLRIGSGSKLSFYEAEASANANDTLTVSIALLLPITSASDGSDVTWDASRSTNAAQTTIAASTVSAANTMQAVLLP